MNGQACKQEEEKFSKGGDIENLRIILFGMGTVKLSSLSQWTGKSYSGFTVLGMWLRLKC